MSLLSTNSRLPDPLPSEDALLSAASYVTAGASELQTCGPALLYMSSGKSISGPMIALQMLYPRGLFPGARASLTHQRFSMVILILHFLFIEQ